jgi:hypothetical protein
MTREEVIEHLCDTVGIVFHSIKDFSSTSDCFCGKCYTGNFQHSGKTLEYVREAVIEKLKADGYKIVGEDK